MREQMLDFLTFLNIEHNLSKDTISAYENDLNDYFNFLKVNDVKSITKENINNYLKKLNERHLADKTINQHLTAIKMFHRYLLKEQLVLNDVSEKISHAKLKKTLPTVMSTEEVDKLLDVELKTPFDFRNKTMLELLYATGIRVSELIDLKVHDINIEACVLKCTVKGNKERIVPINYIAMKYLTKYLEYYRELLKKTTFTEALFLNNHGKKITRQGFYLIIQNLAKNKGIKKPISPHTFRHSFATHLLENGADIKIVQELLGHADVTTTNIYTHISNNKIRKDYVAYHPHSER